ncbi:MAG: cytochrome c family protein [Hyphomicrobiales bacterium]
MQTADAASTAPAAQTAAGAPDAAAGKSVFSKCKSCHTIDANGKNGMGPNLYGVVNRPIASVAGFAYSDAMKGKASGTWTPADLDTYLADVKGTVPGTKMSFAGLANAADRANLIAFLAQNSATPIAAADLGLPGAAAAAPAAAAPAADAAAAPAEAAPAIVYSDPPAQSDAEKAEIAKTVTALEATLSGMDYQRARYHALHFKPAIDKASNEECLACHKEVLGTNVRDASPAGLANTASMAWYQTLATYDGAQATFHQRHMTTPYAQAVMNLKCTFCHQGNDPREEAPQMTVAPADMTSNNGSEPFTLRKMVNPSETCLRCHGAMPDPEKIMGLPGKWPDIRKDMETADAPNGCLTCHGETIRTNRHNVTYLNAATIEDLARESSDVCYGCHGGRQWYHISIPIRAMRGRAWTPPFPIGRRTGRPSPTPLTPQACPTVTCQEKAREKSPWP